MADKLRVSITNPAVARSGEVLDVLVEVTNTSSRRLAVVQPDAVLVPGRPRAGGLTVPDAERDELTQRKEALVDELQKQVLQASRKLERQQKSVATRFMDLLPFLIPGLNLIWALSHTVEDESGPMAQAMKIHTWDDVVNLEEQFIAPLPESSRLRKGFYLNKEKLQRCLGEMQKKNESAKPVSLEQEAVIRPGETEVFAFHYGGGFVLRPTTKKLAYKTQYRDLSSGTVGTHSATSSVELIPSSWIVAGAAASGAAAGFVIRLTLVDLPDGFWTGVLQFAGVVLLAALVTAALTRSTRSSKPIAIEDAVGGFFVGGLVGLFSDEILEWLETLLPSSGSET